MVLVYLVWTGRVKWGGNAEFSREGELSKPLLSVLRQIAQFQLYLWHWYYPEGMPS